MRPNRPTRSIPATLGLLVVAAAAALLVGCGSSVKLDEAPVETRTARPNDASTPDPRSAAGTTPAGATPPAGAATAGAAPASSGAVTTVTAGQPGPGAAGGWPAQRVVYFDFDSYVVRPDAKPVIEGHARVLAADKGRRLVLEGHTDERGGREYNLALGQKRAEAVARSLVLLGVGESQLEAVSFGKERPAAEGSDEAAWEKNRRVELKEKR